jgi:hypothetical protein
MIMFQEALLLGNNINLFYNKKTFVKINGKVPPPFTWHIIQMIIDYLFLMVSDYVLN